MFLRRSKTNHIGGFIKEPIKLSVRTWDGMLLKEIAQLTDVNFKSIRITCSLRCWEGLCDKKTFQTLQISWHLRKFTLSATVDKLPIVPSEK